MAPQLTKAAALVFGAAALDVISSSAQLTAAVSGAAAASSTFPGLVSLAPGGVAFNICQCLSALEFPFTLATALGDDFAGEFLRKSVQESFGPLCRLKTPFVPSTRVQSTGVVAMLFEPRDKGGELIHGVASMDIIEQCLTPQYMLQTIRDCQKRCSVCVIEGNVPANSIVAVAQFAQTSGLPLWVEPVSIPKAQRIARALQDCISEIEIELMTPNLCEARAMAQVMGWSADLSLHPDNTLPAAAVDAISVSRYLHRRCPGVKCWVITLGKHGALFSGQRQGDLSTWETWIPPLASASQSSSGNVNGLGDALFATMLVCRFRLNLDLHTAATAGVIVSSMLYAKASKQIHTECSRGNEQEPIRNLLKTIDLPRVLNQAMSWRTRATTKYQTKLTARL